MSKSLYLVPLFTLGLAVTGASVQAGPRDADHHGDAAESAAWHNEMCGDRYAQGVSRMAYIETRLALTDAQRPAFDAWKSVILSGAKSRQDACLHQTPGGDEAPTIVEREQRRQHMLHAGAEFLDAELPALTALYQTLTPEQKLAFDGPRHERQDHDGDHAGHHRHGGGGDDGGV